MAASVWPSERWKKKKYVGMRCAVKENVHSTIVLFFVLFFSLQNVKKTGQNKKQEQDWLWLHKEQIFSSPSSP